MSLAKSPLLARLVHGGPLTPFELSHHRREAERLVRAGRAEWVDTPNGRLLVAHRQNVRWTGGCVR